MLLRWNEGQSPTWFPLFVTNRTSPILAEFHWPYLRTDTQDQILWTLHRIVTGALVPTQLAMAVLFPKQQGRCVGVPSENPIVQHGHERFLLTSFGWKVGISFMTKQSCDLFVTTRHANVLHPKPINGRQCRMAAAFEPTAMPVPAHSLTSGPDERGIPHS